MLIVRAPLRISFAGGGTDLSNFYRASPGRVISSAINAYMYTVINMTPLINKVTARYSLSETVDRVEDLEHHRTRAALADMGIQSNIEIGYFSHLPSRTGLGSSSSLSVSLIKGLHAYQGKKINAHEAAEAACRLEIDLLGEPIGKQDQYAAAFGGFHVYQFNPDESVEVDPVLLDYKKRLDFEQHALLFFTGMRRDASSVLTEQKQNTKEKHAVLQAMADLVLPFREELLAGNFKALGEMLHEGWQRKRGLASGISNSFIDALYEAGRNNGAWGGKVLGAGGGGCLLFLAPPEAHDAIRKGVTGVSNQHYAKEFREIPVQFVQSGAEVVFNATHLHS